MPVTIPLTQGKVALIDAADLTLVSKFKWCAMRNRKTFYAMTNIRRPDGTRMLLPMHRILLNAPPDIECDHIDGDGLNNIRSNLRLATRAENQRNRGKNRNNTTGFKGVSFRKETRKFQAHIRLNGRRVYLGLFPTPEAAHAAYCAAAMKLHGAFARTG